MSLLYLIVKGVRVVEDLIVRPVCLFKLLIARDRRGGHLEILISMSGGI
jgi:hypothetical protein